MLPLKLGNLLKVLLANTVTYDLKFGIYFIPILGFQATVLQVYLENIWLARQLQPVFSARPW